MQGQDGKSVPKVFWAAAGIGLLWNAFGAYLYMLARLDPQAALAGADPAMKAYVLGQPLWANIGYGLGIWGSLFGSLAMMLRSRHAAALFAVSFIGAAVSHIGQALAGVLPLVLMVVIMAVIALLWWYARRSAALGILR